MVEPREDSVGSRLRLLRGARHLTLTQLSARTGLSVSFLSRLERGERRLHHRRDLFTLADGLGVDASELSGRTEAQHDPVRQAATAAAVDPRRALLAPRDMAAPPIELVARRVDQAIGHHIDCDFAARAELLPGVLDECAAGVRGAVGEDEQQQWSRLHSTALVMALVQCQGARVARSGRSGVLPAPAGGRADR